MTAEADGRLLSQIKGAGSYHACRSGYTLRVARELRRVFNRHLKVANVLVGNFFRNFFQMVGAEKLKERLLY